MPPATEQQTKRKRESQAAKNSIENQKIRVLDMLQSKLRKALLQSSSLASQWANNDYLARCQQQARHTYTLPPGVSSDDLSEEQITHGNFYLQPSDRYTKRQQDLLDMDEGDGSEDGWT